MSYKSSYKSSSYRASSRNEDISTGTSSSSSLRLRGRVDNDDDSSSYSVKYASRRAFNHDDASGPSSSLDDDLTSRSSRRLTSRFSTESDDLDTPTSRYSKYKFSSTADDYSVSKNYSKYGSRDESETFPSSSSRISRYSSLDADDDIGYSSSIRKQGRLSYLNEDEDDISTSSRSYTRRITSDSFKDSLDDSTYKYSTTHVDNEPKSYSSLYSSTESTGSESIRKRYQSSASRSLTRLDSKDAGQVYEAILDYQPPRSATDEISLKEGQEVIVLSKDKQHKWKVRTRKCAKFPKVEEGFAPSAYLSSKNETVELEISEVLPEQSNKSDKDEQATMKDLKKKKDMIVRELVETEEDLIRDMQFVQRTYIRQSESGITPKEIKAVKQDIFGCFKELLSFHNDVLLKNFQTLSKEPTKIGTLFLKLAPEFNDHTKYCKNLSKALNILEENSDISEFFNNYSAKIRDEKTLADHLKLPSQRISDYQLLIKELSKHLSRMDENVDDLEKAIKVIAAIPDKEIHDGSDDSGDENSLKKPEADSKLPEISLPGHSSEKLSKLLKNVLQAKDYFDVTESDGKKNEKYIFLFKTRLFIAEINKNISESQRTYNVQRIVKLADVTATADDDNAKAIMIKSKDLTDKNYPILLKAKTEEQAKTWLDLINTTPKSDDVDDDKSEQNLLNEENGLFTQTLDEEENKPPTKVDVNNNKINKQLSVDSATAVAETTTSQNAPAAELISESVSKQLDSYPSQDSSSKSTTSAGNANADNLDDTCTEATTVATDNLRSASFSSVDAAVSDDKAAPGLKKTLSYKLKLQIKQPLKALTRHVGETATLECKVSPIGNFNVQWLKDNQVVSGSKYKIHKNEDTYYLDLINLTSEDAGLYTIVVSNSKQSVSSSSTLNVLSAVDSRPTSPGGSFLPHAPKFKVKLKDTELLDGTTVRFELIVRGLPIPNITFFKNDKPLKEDDHLKILFQSKEVFEIMIEHVKPEDAGVYKCVAINTEGQDETIGKIVVSSDKNVFWGLNEEDIKSSLVTDNADTPRSRSPLFKWFKDGSEFEASERFQVQFDDMEDTIALIFQHVKPDDAGLYTCVASTSSGKISCSAELTVQGFLRELPHDPIAPEIKKHLENINVSEGESVAILEAQVSGFPKPKVVWFKEKMELEASEHFKMLSECESENYALVIKNVKDEDSGTYKLKATNELGSVESDAQLTILKKPKFGKIPDKIEVMENAKLLIEATYEAVPAPQVKWFKDGKEINISGRIKEVIEKNKCQLIINNSVSEDAGKYQCSISNDLGKASKDVDVSINSAPKFIKKLEAVEILESEVAKFCVQCSGIPKVQAEFYKEQVLLKKTDKRIVIKEEEEGKFSLTIDKAQKDDEGKYRCVIKNKYGQEEDEAQLTINRKKCKPEFKENLRDIEANVNDEGVRLEVKIDGEPKPACKWYHDGKEIAENDKQFKIVNDDKGSALVISKVLNDHQGVYTCKSENNLGQAETSGNLIVNGLPYVIKHLENVNTAVDIDVKLTAIIKGTPKPEIKWYLDDKEVKNDKRTKYSYDEASCEYTLFISKLQTADIGTYRIEAKNVYGSCVSTAKVTIPSKPVFTKTLKKIVATEMQSNIEMVVQLDKQTSQEPVKWFKNDKEILDKDTNYKKVYDKLDNSYKLIILKATEEMVGNYKCVASNDCGSSETEARFDIITKPKFIKGFKNVEYMEGDNVSMTVQISGFPKPEIAFYKDGQDVSTEATIVIKKEVDDIHVLEIENIRIIMSGEYECRIRNEAGEASSKGLVVVNSKPKIAKDLTDLNVSAGEDILLEVVITGKPNPEIKWFKNGNETSGTERILLDAREEVYKLKVPNSSWEDAGIYHCTAENKFGTASSNKANVNVAKQECVPIFNKHIQDAVVVLNDNVRFETQISSEPQAKLTWCKDGQPLKPSDNVIMKKEGDNDVLILKNLKVEDSGIITCKAQNSKGQVTDTAKLSVHDDGKPKFKRELSQAQVESGQPCRLECQIDGNPSDYAITWFKDDEEIVPNEHYGFVKEPNGTLALLVDSFSAKDAGKFKVQVTNNAGTGCSTAEALLKNEAPKTKPKFIDELKATSIKDKSPLVLKCKVVPSSQLEVKWFCNDKAITESDTVKFFNLPDGTVMLQIDDAEIADSGLYKVQVSNELGKSSSEAKVAVEASDSKPPAKLKELLPTTLIAGNPGFIEFQVDSQSFGDVKFVQNGKQVVPNDRVHIQQLPDGVIRLTLDEVFLGDQGNYDVIFQDANGQVKSSAPVKVKSIPIIQRELTDCAVKDGCSTKFEVQIIGNPKPTITWFKNGLDLQVDSRHVTTFESKDNSYFLVLDKCNLRDEAEYSVTAANEFGEVSSVARLTVIPNDKFEECAPTFMEGLQDIKAKKGDTFSLKAKVNSHPVPEIIWKKNGKEIEMSNRIISNFDGTNVELIVSNCDISDFGTYELTIKNSLDQVSAKANVSAFKEGAPIFTKPLIDREENIKFPTKLTCQIEGFPEPEIKWFFNGKMIESGMKYSIFKEMDELVLIVANPTEIDSGIFECQATNSFGLDKTSANIHFVDKKGEAAGFITKLNDYDVLPEGTARFVACVVGDPKPELKWFKDGQEIKIDNDKYFVDYQDNGMIKFEVRNVSEGDLGKYRCEASNVYGYDNSVAQLNFETVDGLDRMNQTHKSKKSQRRALDVDDIDYKSGGVPMPLLDAPTITKMTDNSLTLFWLPSIPEQPRYPVSYVVEFAKVSDGNWVIYQSNIKDSKCDISELVPFQDYSFRVRVENKFGTSDPSPSCTAHRSNLKDQTEPKTLKTGDFDLEHIPREKIAAAPKFVREEEAFMFGINGQPVTIEFWVYGYPDPNITWFFGDKQLEQGDKYSFMHDRNGKVCLFINKMDASDVGYYTCVAKNEHGEEKKTIKLLHAEPPIFTKRLDETTVSSRNHIRLECFVKGTPEPTIKWFKDFQPLADTSRVNISWESPDHAVLTISDCITRDMGLYSCTATNLAGSTTTAAFIHVNESSVSYEKYPFSYNASIKPKNKPIEQFYDLGDELGRGTQGIVYHAVERITGNSFSMKMMHGMGEMKQYMMNEMDIMNHLGTHQNLVQLRDAFQTNPHSLSLAMDLCGGGTLLNFILKKGFLTENEVAYYIRQILEGLQYMHFKNTGHFGLTIGDILLDRMNGLDIKICDFGLAKRNVINHFVEFGHPEFVSPEIVDKNSVTFTADTWSAGIIAYILLTGISPFLAENDKATLCNIQNKNLDLSDKMLGHISHQGKDFLKKMLDYDSISRLDVKGALNHPWLKFGNDPEGGSRLDVIDRLREYQSKYSKWYQNASCKRYYRRRLLHSCYTHPSRMIYPPDEQYSPLISPEREFKKYTKTVSPFENVYPPNQNEGDNFQSESHYQCGPDTYLLQLRDTAFPARIRRYLRIAATNSPSIATNLKQAHWGGNTRLDMSGYTPQVSIKERRKFIDVMDEEINDEMKGFTNRTKPMRLVREVGTSSYAYGQLNSLRKEAKTLHSEMEESINLIKPFFREKMNDVAFKNEEDVVFTCYAVGSPDPSYTWFKNDTILIENSRIEVKRTSDGRCQLKIKPGKEYDVGIYKCIARNSQGSVVCRARLSLGDVPGTINPPLIKDISAKSILLAWSLPKFDGHSCIKQYKVEFKKNLDENWLTADAGIKQEFFIVNDLEPNSLYHFRLSAYNKFGWSQPSVPSEIGQTLSTEESKTISLPPSMLFDCGPMNEAPEDNAIPELDYSNETNAISLIKSDFKELYDFKSIIMKGKFSIITRAYIKDGSRSTLACKCVLVQSENESSINNEYEISKSLVHERISKLLYANKDGNMFTLATELLSGLNVLTYLTRKQFYTEETVTKIVCQVLDAIEYLHYRGIGLLELQPDNVLIVDDRKLQIKLTDFANARRVAGENVKVNGLVANPEYIAPELIKSDEATLPYTDIWAVGVLAYILLSGHSPFKGIDPKETAQNVVFVRYLFDRLYTEVTQESIRFLLTVFKLTPHKRPTIEECFDNKWLIPNEFMMKKREMAVFSSAKLNEFSDDFFAKKSTSHSRLQDLIGVTN